MPSKRKRVATRQAQLSRRKRRDRTKVPHQEIAPNLVGRTDSGSSLEVEVPSPSVGMNTASVAASAMAERPAFPVQQMTLPHRLSGVHSVPLPCNTHLITELMLIGIITRFVVVALADLTVSLR